MHNIDEDVITESVWVITLSTQCVLIVITWSTKLVHLEHTLLYADLSYNWKF